MVTITLTEQQFYILDKALATAPIGWIQINPVIIAIKQQIQKQVEAQEIGLEK